MDAFAAGLWIGALIAGGLGFVQLGIATFGRMEGYERDAQVRYAIALFLAAIALAVIADTTITLDLIGVFGDDSF